MNSSSFINFWATVLVLSITPIFTSCSDEPGNFDSDLYNDVIKGEETMFMHAWFGSLYSNSGADQKWVNLEQERENNYKDMLYLPKTIRNSLTCECYVTIARGKIWFTIYKTPDMCGADPDFAIIYEAWSDYCSKSHDYTNSFYITADLKKDKTFQLSGKTYNIEKFTDNEFRFSTASDNGFLTDMNLPDEDIATNRYKFVWKYRPAYAPDDFVSDSTVGYDSFKAFISAQLDKMEEFDSSYDVKGISYTIEQLRQIVEQHSSKWEPTAIQSVARYFTYHFGWYAN